MIVCVRSSFTLGVRDLLGHMKILLTQQHCAKLWLAEFPEKGSAGIFAPPLKGFFRLAFITKSILGHRHPRQTRCL